MLSFFKKNASRGRLIDSWNYHVPLLMSIPYLFILAGEVETQQAWITLVAALSVIVGFGGLGFLLESFFLKRFGVNENRLKIFNSSKGIIGVLLAFFLCILAVVPWFYFPLDHVSIVLITLELSLFGVYYVLPRKLKEISLLRIVVHSLYRQVVPSVLASWTFFLVGGSSYPWFAAIVCVVILWQFLSGIRNSLEHLLTNSNFESINGIRQELTGVGEKRVVFYLENILLPAETIAFFGFGLFVFVEFEWYLPLYFLFLFVSIVQFYPLKKYGNIHPFKRFSRIFLDDFYSQWFPLIVLTGIIFIKTEVTFIFLTHLLIFKNGFKSFLLKLTSNWRTWKLTQWIYGFTSYTRGLVIHLGVMVIYFGLFVFGYYILESNVTDESAFLYHQAQLSKLLIVVIIIHFVSLILLRKKETVRTIRSFFLEKGSPYNLAIFRIIMFHIILGSIYGEVFGDFLHWTYLPHSAREGLPFIGWLIDILPISPELYMTLGSLAFVLAASILVGFQTRWALILYVPIALYLWGVPNFFGKLNHRHIMVWVPMILAFSRCYDVLSIDAFIAKRRGKKKEAVYSLRYMLPFKMIWLLLAVIYMCSGFHKLWDTGLFWALSDNLSNQIQLEWVEHYDTVSAIRIDHYPILLRILALGVILMEIVYPLLILKQSTRIFALLSAWSLHISAGYFLYIDFVQLRIVHLSYVNWTRIASWFNKRKRKLSESIEINSFTQVYRMPLLYVGGFMVCINLIFGIIQINTWPFSSYPAYSSVVKNEVDLIEMIVTDKDGRPIDVKGIAKRAKFRWETIRPFEEQIARHVRGVDTNGLQVKLENYWNLWATKLDSLDRVHTVVMNLKTTPIVPERRSELLDSVYLGTIRYHELD